MKFENDAGSWLTFLKRSLSPMTWLGALLEKLGYRLVPVLQDSLGACPIASAESSSISSPSRSEAFGLIRSAGDQLMRSGVSPTMYVQNLDLMRQLVGQAPLSIAMFDRKMTYLASSPSWNSSHGLGLFNPVGLSHYSVVKNISEDWKEFHRRGLQGEVIHKRGDAFVDNQNQRVWFNWSIVPWIGTDQKVGGVVITTEDVTQEYLSKETLKNSEERFSLAMQGASDGIYDWNVIEDTLYLSPRWYEMLGYRAGELPARLLTWKRLMDKSEYVKNLKYLVRAMADPQCLRFHVYFKMKHKNGAWIKVLSRGQIVRDGYGTALRVIGTQVDQTNLEELRSELHNARMTAKAEAESNSAKSRFLATVSHEIRNPLNGIMGFSKLIEESTNDEAIRNWAHLLGQTTQGLEHILNDILDFAKIDAGRMEILNTAFDLGEIFDSLAEIKKVRCKTKGLNFVATKHLPQGSCFVGDPVRIRQVAQNLLSNAVKFTSQGTIRFSLHATSSRPGFQFLHLTVKDTGLGIPESKQRDLFKPFSQLHLEPGLRQSGTGLGLSIVQSLVHMMGGTIRCESVECQGTEFSIVLELKEAPALVRTRDQGDQSDQSSLKVLIADDHEVNRKVISSILTKAGHQVVDASDGREALSHLQAALFDFVFLDLDMPYLTGQQVIRTMRQTFGPNQSTPAACVSGHVMSDTVDQLYKDGFNHFFPKPLDFDLIRNTLRKCKARDCLPMH